MKTESSRAPSPRWGRRVLLLLFGLLAWTLISCYPNPLVLARNLARYRRLPIDPTIESKMGWHLPAEPGQIELFVDALLVPSPDWPLYRVPWYVPTALEAASSSHGDCEAKAVLLASLLAARNVPFQIRASLNHIWVDYSGRAPRPGETQNLAYLTGEPGRLRLRWPEELPWRQVLTAQRQQLWDAMPLARKTLWLLGLLSLGLAALFAGGRAPEGEFASDWRPRAVDCLWRSCLLALFLLLFAAIAANFWRSAGRGAWKAADFWEVLAAVAAAAALAAWLTSLRSRRSLTLAKDGSRLLVCWSLGLRRGDLEVETSKVAHFVLDTSTGGLHPWTISAALRTGEHIPLLHCRREVPARAALRSLGTTLDRPLLVRSDGFQAWTMADEIPLSLRERAARRPESVLPPRPRGCVLEVEQGDGTWIIKLPPLGRRAGLELLVIAAIPVLFVVLATLGLWQFPRHAVFWIGWVIAASLLGLTTYAAMLLKGEIIAYLAGVRLEIGQGLLRYHTPARTVETIELDRIQAIEIARRGETPTLAAVSPDRVLHIRGLGSPEHREWVRKAIERAVASAS